MGKWVQVYSAKDLHHADLLKSVLEAQGYRVMIDNESLQGLLGEVPYGTATAPRLLVEETQAVEARKVFLQLEASTGSALDADKKGKKR